MAISGALTTSFSKKIVQAIATGGGSEAGTSLLNFPLKLKFATGAGSDAASESAVEANLPAVDVTLSWDNDVHGTAPPSLLTNADTITIGPPTEAVTGISHCYLYRSNNFTFQAIGTDDRDETYSSGGHGIFIPKECGTIVNVGTVTAVTPTSLHKQTVTFDPDVDIGSSFAADAYSDTDLNSRPTHVVTCRNPCLSNLTLNILAGGGTNEIVLGSSPISQNLIGEIVEIRELPSLADLFGDPSVTDDIATDPYLVSNFKAGSSSTADRVYIEEVGSTATWGIFYPQGIDIPGFAGGDGWRKLGASSSADYSATKVPIGGMSFMMSDGVGTEVTEYYENLVMMKPNSNANRTITMQTGTEEMIARFEYDDTSFDLSIGESLLVAAGDLKLTID